MRKFNIPNKDDLVAKAAKVSAKVSVTVSDAATTTVEKTKGLPSDSARASVWVKETAKDAKEQYTNAVDDIRSSKEAV